MTDELQGRLVWVHPELTHDPGGKKDLIGLIVASDLAADIVLVSFEDNMPGLFSADALFVFHSPEKISAMFAEAKLPESGPGPDVLIKINSLVHTASPGDQRLALELARAHPMIQPFCLETLKDQLSRDQPMGWNR